MTRLPGLDFVDGGLTVVYCPSLEPQELELATTFTKDNSRTTPKRRALTLKNFVELGFAGSDVFPPEAGRAEIVSVKPESGSAKSMAIKLRVSALAPVSLRRFVEELRLASNPNENSWIKAMSVVGSRPVEAGGDGVTEAAVRAWFDDPKQAPRPWADVPFEVIDTGEAKTAWWRAVLTQKVTPALREGLEVRAIVWLQTWGFDALGQPSQTSAAARLPEIASAKREVTVRYQRFNLDRRVLFGLLVNSLTSFHHRVAPLEKVEIGL